MNKQCKHHVNITFYGLFNNLYSLIASYQPIHYLNIKFIEKLTQLKCIGALHTYLAYSYYYILLLLLLLLQYINNLQQPHKMYKYKYRHKEIDAIPFSYTHAKAVSHSAYLKRHPVLERSKQTIVNYTFIYVYTTDIERINCRMKRMGEKIWLLIQLRPTLLLPHYKKTKMSALYGQRRRRAARLNSLFGSNGFFFSLPEYVRSTQEAAADLFC